MSLGKLIKEKREELHMTQEELAEKLNVSRQAVSKWESGLSMPAEGNLQELCKLLDLTTPPEDAAAVAAPQEVCAKTFVDCLCDGLGRCLCPGDTSGRAGVAARGTGGGAGHFGCELYDGEGREVNREANWYALTASTTVVITYEGAAPDAATIYLTPSGSETFSERKQLAVIPCNDARKGYILVRLTFAESMMGHLQVALDYGSTSVFSDLYNVFLE